MATFLYVDNLKVWVEGMRLSAVRVGIAAHMRAAQEANFLDPGWRIDFGNLSRLVGDARNDLKRVFLVGSPPPPKDSLWQAAEEKGGFEVDVVDLSPITGVNKLADSTIVTAMMKDGYKRAQAGDEFVLVAGDAEYAPPVAELLREKIAVTVAFWSHAISWRLKEAGGRILDLDAHFVDLTKEEN